MDLVAGYAAQLPVTVIAEILGVPMAMREQFLAWGNGAAVTLDIGISYQRVPARRTRPHGDARLDARALRAAADRAPATTC